MAIDYMRRWLETEVKIARLRERLERAEKALREIVAIRTQGGNAYACLGDARSIARDALQEQDHD
jgi:hypothetical protein